MEDQKLILIQTSSHLIPYRMFKIKSNSIFLSRLSLMSNVREFIGHRSNVKCCLTQGITKLSPELKTRHDRSKKLNTYLSKSILNGTTFSQRPKSAASVKRSKSIQIRKGQMYIQQDELWTNSAVARIYVIHTFSIRNKFILWPKYNKVSGLPNLFEEYFCW